MAKPILRVSLAKLPSQNSAAMRLKAAAKPVKMAPKAAGKLKATPDEAAAIDRANRAQAREAQFVRTTVSERPTPMKKKK